MSARDPLAEVIYQHRTKAHPHCWECSCGFTMNYDRTVTPYVRSEEHLADAVRAFLASDETVERAQAALGGTRTHWVRTVLLAAAMEVRP